MIGKVGQQKNTNFQQMLGFTIVETMIVLAITGFLFISFAFTMQGKQSSTKFKQAVTSFQTDMNGLINQSQSGYYPSSSLQCDTTTGQATAGSNEQGSNNGCVVLGKAVWFRGATYTVYPISGIADQANFGASSPRTIGTLSQDVTLQHGLEVVWSRLGGGGSPVGAVAFIPSFNNTGGALYGSGTTQVLPVNNISALGASYTSIGPDPSEGVEVCLRSGGSGASQSALVTIGGRAGSNTVSLSIKGNNNCA